jgi:mRNA interferase YafQ
MRVPAYTKQFLKDVQRAGKRGKNIEKLKLIVRSLIASEKLDPIHRDHGLIGDFANRRECHIESDWSIVYKLEDDAVVFERTGSHADLFG